MLSQEKLAKLLDLIRFRGIRRWVDEEFELAEFVRQTLRFAAAVDRVEWGLEVLAMAILELSDQQVVALVKQLLRAQKRLALWTLAEDAARGREERIVLNRELLCRQFGLREVNP